MKEVITQVEGKLVEHQEEAIHQAKTLTEIEKTLIEEERKEVNRVRPLIFLTFYVIYTLNWLILLGDAMTLSTKINTKIEQSPKQ